MATLASFKSLSGQDVVNILTQAFNTFIEHPTVHHLATMLAVGGVIGGIVLAVLAYFPGEPTTDFDEKIAELHRLPSKEKDEGEEEPSAAAAAAAAPGSGGQPGLRRRKPATGATPAAAQPQVEPELMPKKMTPELLAVQKALFGTDDPKEVARLIAEAKARVAQQEAEGTLPKSTPMKLARKLDIVVYLTLIGAIVWVLKYEYQVDFVYLFQTYFPTEASVFGAGRK